MNTTEDFITGVRESPTETVSSTDLHSLRTTQMITHLSKKPPERDYTELYRSVVARILSGEQDRQFEGHHRLGTVLALDRLRVGDEDLLHQLEQYVLELLRGTEETESHTDDVVAKTRCRERRQNSFTALKYVRFLLAAYFTELGWREHERRRAQQRSGGHECVRQRVNDSELNACVRAAIAPLKEQRHQKNSPYGTKLCSLYEHALSKAPAALGVSDAITHQQAGNETGAFYSSDFLRITPSIYSQYLWHTEGRIDFTEDDKPIVLELGASTIAIIERLAAGDIETFKAVASGGGKGKSYSGSFRIPQDPTKYAPVRRSVKDETRWTVELRPEYSCNISSLPTTALACPASYAKASDGRTVIRALCDENYDYWQHHQLHCLFESGLGGSYSYDCSFY